MDCNCKLGRPLAGKILVKPIMPEKVTASGILMPESKTEKPLKGEVIAIGKPKGIEEMEVSVGDIVLYGKYAGTEININDETYLLLVQNDVLLIFDK